MICIPLCTTSFYEAMTADATLQGLLGMAPMQLFEFHPQENGPVVPSYPFAMYNFSSKDWGDKSDAGEDLQLQVDIFDQSPGFQLVQAVSSRMYQLIHETKILQTPELAITLQRYVNYVQMRDTDGVIVHGVLAFRILSTYNPQD